MLSLLELTLTPSPRSPRSKMITAQRLALFGLAIGTWAVKAWDHVSPEELKRVMSEVDVPVLVAFVKEDANEPERAIAEEGWRVDAKGERFTGPARTDWFEEQWAAATSLADKHYQIMLSIDCSAHPADCEIQPSMTYPSIFLLQADRPPLRYLGAVVQQALLGYLTRDRQPVRINNRDELAAFRALDEFHEGHKGKSHTAVDFILFLPNADDDQPILSAYQDLTRNYSQEFDFGLVLGISELLEAEKIDVNDKGALVAYKLADQATEKFDLASHDFTTPESSRKAVSELEKFIKQASRPVITDLTAWNHPRLIELGRPIVYLFADTSFRGLQLREQFYRFAKDYYNQLTTVLVDPYLFPDLMPKLGLLDTRKFPSGAVHILSENKMYPYPQGQEMTIAKVQGWGMKIWQGEIEPWTPGGKSDTKGGKNNRGGSDSGIRIQGKVGTKRKVTVGGWGKGKIPNIPRVKINILGVGRDEL